MAEDENNGYMAYSVVGFWQKILRHFDEDTLANLYRTCIEICLTGMEVTLDILPQLIDLSHSKVFKIALCLTTFHLLDARTTIFTFFFVLCYTIVDSILCIPLKQFYCLWFTHLTFTMSS